MTPRELANRIMDILENKNASQILGLDVAHLTSITEYFIIASGKNVIQVRTLAEEVEEKLAEEGIAPRRKEGYHDSRWIVLDYGDAVVHIFHEQEREYYNIERLWMDGSNVIRG